MIKNLLVLFLCAGCIAETQAAEQVTEAPRECSEVRWQGTTELGAACVKPSDWPADEYWDGCWAALSCPAGVDPSGPGLSCRQVQYLPDEQRAWICGWGRL